MCARPDSTDPRDGAFARLAADVLKSPATSGQDCPDAALVAAYADRGLAEDERLHLETHFAECEHCQQTLAALGASLDAVQTHAVAAVGPAPVVAIRSPKRWLWWLTPAFGAAAAALLWMALRPVTPTRVETAADYSRAAQLQPQAGTRDELAQNEIAQAPAAGRDGVAATANATEAALDKVSRRDAEAKASAGALSASSEAASAAAGPRALTRVPAPAASAEGQPAARQAQAFGAARAAAPAAAPQSALADRLSAGAPPQPVIRYTFTSPAGGIMWRLGDAGSIEKSIDGGRTWQAQVSGVSEDFIAGSAASDQVAWVVGRNRVILRTTDGQTWQRIPPPADVTAQWSVIAARDDMGATIFTDDFRRFATADGGQTWTLVP